MFLAYDAGAAITASLSIGIHVVPLAASDAAAVAFAVAFFGVLCLRFALQLNS